MGTAAPTSTPSVRPFAGPQGENALARSSRCRGARSARARARVCPPHLREVEHVASVIRSRPSALRCSESTWSRCSVEEASRAASRPFEDDVHRGPTSWLMLAPKSDLSLPNQGPGRRRPPAALGALAFGDVAQRGRERRHRAGISQMASSAGNSSRRPATPSPRCGGRAACSPGREVVSYPAAVCSRWEGGRIVLGERAPHDGLLWMAKIRSAAGLNSRMRPS